MNKNNIEKIFNFLFQINQLKLTLRYSTVKKSRGDSSADHSWRLALMVIVLIKELKLDIDELKAIKIALVHDLAECITGDIDYTLIIDGKVKAEDKKEGELKAISKIKKMLPADIGKEIYNLWEEYEEIKSKEAKFIKALDKIETQLHVLQLSKKMIKNDSHSEIIYTYSDKHIENFPELKPVLKLIKEKLIKEFKKANITFKSCNHK